MISSNNSQNLTEIADETLVELYVNDRKQHAHVFDLLVERYQTKVYGLALRMMGNRDEAEEQAQEVFVKIYRSIDRFEGRSRFSTWIYRITVNACLDAIEKRRRRPQVTDAEWSDLGETVAIDADSLRWRSKTPEQAYLQREQADLLYRSLSKLEKPHRDALVQRELEELTYQEMAAASKIGLSAMKMRVHRARKALTSIVQQQVAMGLA